MVCRPEYSLFPPEYIHTYRKYKRNHECTSTSNLHIQIRYGNRSMLRWNHDSFIGRTRNIVSYMLYLYVDHRCCCDIFGVIKSFTLHHKSRVVNATKYAILPTTCPVPVRVRHQLVLGTEVLVTVG
jgi:hypothetical protein